MKIKPIIKFYLYTFALIGSIIALKCQPQSPQAIIQPPKPTERVIPSDRVIADAQAERARQDALIPALNKELSDRPITVGNKTWQNERELIIDVCKADPTIRGCR